MKRRTKRAERAKREVKRLELDIRLHTLAKILGLPPLAARQPSSKREE